jgi:hypothetical protein
MPSNQQLPGVPDECPDPLTFFRAPYTHGLLGFRFPPVPGIPDMSGMKPSARFRNALARGEFGVRKSMPLRAWRSGLASLVGEIDRADYHLERFRETLVVARARRDVGGGPSFGDFDVARAIYCEAVGFLNAVRAAFDVIMYVAARRTGLDGGTASRWQVTDAITPKKPAHFERYDRVEEVVALRAHRNAFETLNLYRNCMLHRGWHSPAFGYFAKTDDAPEADLPQHNVMLVPDQASLARSARPERWTHTERRWLDELVFDLDGQCARAFVDVGNVWGLPDPVDGTASIEERPNVVLFVPRVVPEMNGPNRAIVVFETKKAAKKYATEVGIAGRALTSRPFVRTLRPTKLRGQGTGFLLVYDRDQLGEVAELRVMGLRLGQLVALHSSQLSPQTRLGIGHDTLWLRLPTLATGAIYLLDAPPDGESDDHTSRDE